MEIELPYLMVKEAIESLREMEIQKWIYSVKPTRELCSMVESKGISTL